MGARAYSPTDGRFTQPDPIQGGCANNYTYAFGDPVSNPDVSGTGGCHHQKKHCFLGQCWLSSVGTIATYVGAAAGVVGLVAVGAATFGIGDVAILGTIGTISAATGGAATLVSGGISCGEGDAVGCAGAGAELLLGGVGYGASSLLEIEGLSDASKLGLNGIAALTNVAAIGGVAPLYKPKKC